LESAWQELREFIFAQLEMLSETTQRFLIGVLFAVAQVVKQRKHRSLKIGNGHEFTLTANVDCQLAGRLFYSQKCRRQIESFAGN